MFLLKSPPFSVKKINKVNNADMKVNVYIGKDKLSEQSYKNYKCISKTVKDAVNDAYYGYLSRVKEKEDK